MPKNAKSAKSVLRRTDITTLRSYLASFCPLEQAADRLQLIARQTKPCSSWQTQTPRLIAFAGAGQEQEPYLPARALFVRARQAHQQAAASLSARAAGRVRNAGAAPHGLERYASHQAPEALASAISL